MLDWLAGQSSRAQGIGPERQGLQDVVPTEPHLARG